MRFILTITLAISFSLFAMNVATHTLTTVDLMKSHNQYTDNAIIALEQGKKSKIRI